MFKFFCILIFLSTNLFASDLGITGVIDTPSARMQDDGKLKVTFNHQRIANITNITYQATPWLETTFRYTYSELYQDRSYAAKITLLKESDFKPNIAVGIQDILGTGVWGSEYIVASKKISDFDISLGLGWGRLANQKTIKNPLLNLSNSFLDRDRSDAVNSSTGGKLRSDSFFKGSRVGIFGGIKYTIPNTNLKLLAEYNTDIYSNEMNSGVISDNSPLNYGIEWSGPSGLNLNLTHQQGGLGLSFSSTLDTKASSRLKKIEPFYSSYNNEMPSAVKETVNLDSWYSRLVYDFQQSGLFPRNAKILPNNKVIIEFSNFKYNLAADAINRALTLSQIHIPREINNIDLILNERGFRVITIGYLRANPNNNFIFNGNYDQIEISAPHRIKNPTNYTKLVIPYINFDANLAARFQLFDPLKPAKHQVYLKIMAVTNISQNWNLIGSFAVDINHNFDLNRGPESVLPHVRTDINKYLFAGSSGIESLYLEKNSSFNEEIHYRAYLGILEGMYSGAGVEVLFQPFMSRLALGGTINRVIKRGYERNFELMDYKASTGFVSLDYASPFYNYDFAIHVGRYLAGDKGATMEVRRTFDNGFSVGAFVTRTNVSADDYGEGSFDKGLYFRIPFDSFSSRNEKGSYSTVIRSLQRDGGQKLDDFTGRLWFDLRSVRYDSLTNTKSRMISK